MIKPMPLGIITSAAMLATCIAAGAQSPPIPPAAPAQMPAPLPPPTAQNPLAISTFHCIGLYWSPPGGSADKEVQVRYRPHGQGGQGEWKRGLPMRYNPIDGTDEDLADYRGSIVHLTPDTAYDIELTLAGTATAASLTARTWSEKFPVGQTIRVENANAPLEIRESGTPEAWRVYDGAGAVIDVRHQHGQCVRIDASYVILRGLTLKGAFAGDLKSGKAGGAIEIISGHDIVIENCDISDWGHKDPKTGFNHNMDSGIYSRARSLKRLVIQRCRIHHPTFDGSNWHEPVYPTHTAGAQAISLFDTDGNHVIRYNECWSDLEHMYNDVIGGGSNGSFRGSPGPDSDIYQNVIGHCWDDGLEVEGGGRNVRVWGNYITQSAMGIGNAATSIGPLYIWRNVSGRSQVKPQTQGYNFIKMGFAGSEKWMTGHQYIFHNTVFNEDGWLPVGGLGNSRIVKHTTSRNNILVVRSAQGRSLSSNPSNIDDDYDYDLYNGQIPEKSEAHGVKGQPVYGAGAGFDWKTRTGRFQLKADSAGAGVGVPIPNFSDGYSGSGPDMGAHQRGNEPMQFGVDAK